MSLCPSYCECEPCEHFRMPCSGYPCPDCAEIIKRKNDQKEHERSVERQKMKIRIPKWKGKD